MLFSRLRAKRVAMQPNFIRVTEMQELWPLSEGMKGFRNLCKILPSMISCKSVLQLNCALHTFVLKHLFWSFSLLVQFNVLGSYNGRIRDQYFPVKLCQSRPWLSALCPELSVVIYCLPYASCSTNLIILRAVFWTYPHPSVWLLKREEQHSRCSQWYTYIVAHLFNCIVFFLAERLIIHLF